MDMCMERRIGYHYALCGYANMAVDFITDFLKLSLCPVTKSCWFIISCTAGIESEIEHL